MGGWEEQSIEEDEAYIAAVSMLAPSQQGGKSVVWKEE
jgi:hypothetical protein